MEFECERLDDTSVGVEKEATPRVQKGWKQSQSDVEISPVASGGVCQGAVPLKATPLFSLF